MPPTSTPNSFPSSPQDRRAKRRENYRICKREMLDELREIHAIASVEIDFDGGGDQGAAGDVRIMHEDGKTFPELQISGCSVIIDLCSQFAWAALDLMYPGWENEGGIFDIENGLVPQLDPDKDGPTYYGSRGTVKVDVKSGLTSIDCIAKVDARLLIDRSSPITIEDEES